MHVVGRCTGESESSPGQCAASLLVAGNTFRTSQCQLPALDAQGRCRVQSSSRPQSHRPGVDRDCARAQLRIDRAAGQPVGRGGDRAAAGQRSAAQVERAHRIVVIRARRIQDASGNSHRRPISQFVAAAQGQRAPVDVNHRAGFRAAQGCRAGGHRHRAAAKVGCHRAALQCVGTRRQCFAAAAQGSSAAQGKCPDGLGPGKGQLAAAQVECRSSCQKPRRAQRQGATADVDCRCRCGPVQRGCSAVGRDYARAEIACDRAAGQCVAGRRQCLSAAAQCASTLCISANGFRSSQRQSAAR